MAKPTRSERAKKGLFYAGLKNEEADRIVDSIQEEELVDLIARYPVVGLFKYWQVYKVAAARGPCPNGTVLSNALRALGFRDAVVADIPLERVYLGDSVAGWAEAVANRWLFAAKEGRFPEDEFGPEDVVLGPGRPWRLVTEYATPCANSQSVRYL